MVDYKQTFNQFWRYVLIGLFTTGIDFGVLNFLSWSTGITKGNGLIPLNVISFGAAITTGFFLHKYISFQDHSLGQNQRQFMIFLVVTLVGVFINTTIVNVIATYIQPRPGFSPHEWLNVAKVAATACSMLWNFFGFKVYVFKK